MKIITVLFLLFISFQSYSAAPLGLKWGISEKELAELVGHNRCESSDNTTNTCYFLTPPKPFSLALSYSATFVKNHGLSLLTIYSISEIDNKNFMLGALVYNQIKELLDKKYGLPISQNFNDIQSSCDTPEGCGMWMSLYDDKVSGPVTLVLRRDNDKTWGVYNSFTNPVFIAFSKAKDKKVKASDLDAL